MRTSVAPQPPPCPCALRNSSSQGRRKAAVESPIHPMLFTWFVVGKEREKQGSREGGTEGSGPAEERNPDEIKVSPVKPTALRWPYW